ncbi:hypothetical protein E4O04_11565 [Treponema sp. OMZ 799]|uniref:hypothetical protein n=1 Tax=Treponema sp. OMZ 799 TaxID=2563668 RepID=UPI0020A32359|nr:hypothetical protein [Treponema sp. OMZ 799]UTC78597.1 hypothetical protein E4O04_11565 [Treponema sp. OMZ 799]
MWGSSHPHGGELSVSSDKLKAELTIKDKQSIKLTLKFVSVTGTQLTIDYDGSVKRVFIMKNGTSIPKGSKVDAGTEIVIEANLSAGMVIDKCLVNGKPVSGEIMMGSLIYKVNRADADSNKTLKFSFTEKTPSKGTVHWGTESPMTCKTRNQYGNWIEINNGGEVQEGDQLNFYAKLPQGKVVDKWTVNGLEVSSGSDNRPNRFRLTVKPEHFVNGKITIAYTAKGAVKGTVHWGTENPMTCKKWNQLGSDTPITNGGEVQEGDELNFYANPPQGQIVDKWTVNGVVTENHSGGNDPNSFWLNVKPEHFVNGKITIGYTVKDLAQTKVNFDDNIRCSVNRNGTDINVESGTTIVYEWESLDFKALGMPYSAVKGWKINNEEPQGWNGQENNLFAFTVTEAYISQALGGAIRVSCELKEGLKSAALDFDSAKIKCLQNSQGNSYEINSGLRVYAGIGLSFKALLSSSEEIKSWKINGIEQEYSESTEFYYTVQESDLIGDNFTVDIMLK